MNRRAVVVSAEPSGATVQAQVIGVFGELGIIADRIDLFDAEDRRIAADWLHAGCGIPRCEVLDALSDARVRMIVRAEIELAGVDRGWAA